MSVYPSLQCRNYGVNFIQNNQKSPVGQNSGLILRQIDKRKSKKAPWSTAKRESAETLIGISALFTRLIGNRKIAKIR
jgi:hypothetical protein